MAATTMTPAQYEVLNAMSCLTMKEDIIALKDVLVQFLNTRLQSELDRLYEQGTLSDDIMEDLSHQHLRTPYTE